MQNSLLRNLTKVRRRQAERCVKNGFELEGVSNTVVGGRVSFH